ncbi:MAG: carboxylesterase, partial [Gammaproteobacteria bacterium RIFOXYB2_FULL_38_6]
MFTLKPLIIETASPPLMAVIWMHGLGADAHDFENIVSQLNLSQNKNFRFIFPNAPVRSITINNGSPTRAWYDVKSLTDLNHEDEKGIRESNQFIETLIEEQMNSGIESKNIFLAGFSQGAAMSLFTGLRYPKPLAGIIALSGYLPLPEKIKTERSSQNQTVPIFMAHGTCDTIVPIQLPQYSKQCLES